MARLEFASSIQRYAPIEALEVSAATIKEALEQAFVAQPALRSYVLDDQGAVRKHVTIFVNDETIADRDELNDPIADNDLVYVIQALSGG